MTRVRVVSLRSFDPLINNLSARAFRAWQKALDWCCFYATDGTLTAKCIKAIGASPADQEELREAGLWQREEDGRTFVAELREGPVVAEVEGSEVGHSLSKGAERQRRWRQRNTELRETPGDVTRDGESETLRDVSGVTLGSTPPSSLSDLKSSPNPESSSVLASDLKDLIGSARVAKPRPKRGPYPMQFPSESELIELLKYGRSKGLRDGQIREELEALELWAKGSGALKLDWMATAKGWLRRVAAGSAPGQSNGYSLPSPAGDNPPARTIIRPTPPDPEAAKVSLDEQRQLALMAAGVGRRMPA